MTDVVDIDITVFLDLKAYYDGVSTTQSGAELVPPTWVSPILSYARTPTPPSPLHLEADSSETLEQVLYKRKIDYLECKETLSVMPNGIRLFTHTPPRRAIRKKCK